MAPFERLADGTQLRVGTHQVTVLQYLSAGGFAHIYKVQIDPAEQDSAIACLKRVIVEDKGGLDALRKEVEVMQTLAHARSIVRYYDLHAQRLDNGTYQVLVLMELCLHGLLLDYMNAKIKTKLSEREILEVALDILVGIYEMHALHLVHRDIKIENVLIDAHHRFKLCDFGLTLAPAPPPALPHEFERLSRDLLYLTTPQYRLPEMVDLARGVPIDEKADIWALGCFLYKVCYYTTPFEASGELAILKASFVFPPQPPYLGDLKNLVIIMLQENAHMRPNIVQVIMLLSRMMGVDFDELHVPDIYRAGAYNFKALAYHQQQMAAMSRSASAYAPAAPAAPALAATPVGAPPPPPAAAPVAARVYATSSRGNSTEDLARARSGRSSAGASGDDDLDNVEERYPSLESLSIEAPPPRAPSSLPPPILPPAELKTLTPEQFQAYNYQHQKYQYEMSKLQYQQRQYQQQYQQQYQAAAPPQHLDSLRSRSKSRKSSEPELERKEAWETQSKPSIDGDTEKLVSDIFGSATSHSADDDSKLLHRYSTRQSSASEKARSRDELSSAADGPGSEPEDVLDEKDLIDFEVQFPETVGEAPCEGAIVRAAEPPTQPSSLPKESDNNPFPHGEAKPEGKGNPWGEYRLEKVAEKPRESQPKPASEEPPKSEPPSTEASQRQFKPQQQQPPPQQQQQPLRGAPVWQEKPLGEAPIWQEQPLKEAPVWQPPPQQWQSPAQPSVYLGESNADASGSPTLTAPLQFAHPPPAHASGSPEMHFAEPRHPRPEPGTPRFGEPVNLIDLEVGLESSSSVSTPVLKPKSLYKTERDSSLLDLNVESMPVRSGPDSRLKKRISLGSQIPTNISFQEEVIDFASDDENPENSSKMSRLAIRNSLKAAKPKRSSGERRLGEHKREEAPPPAPKEEGRSATHKKRLLLFHGT